MKISKVLKVIVLSAFILQTIFVSAIETSLAAVTYGKRMFKVTAYYSPLPGQTIYAKGSYEADIILNGGGKTGASGRGVFVGMLAGPKNYDFGTKIYLEGLGIGTIADRGGAIVNQGIKGQEYDRIDVWMGYGEEGLRRAQRWGVRMVSGEVLTSTTVADSFNFDAGLPPVIARTETTALEIAKADTSKIEKSIVTSALAASFPTDLGRGSNGPNVRVLQAALLKLGVYKGGMTGDYDQNTISAVLSFQLDNHIVESDSEHAAGYFGSQTRKLLVDSITKRGISMDTIESTAFRSMGAEVPIPVKKVETVSVSNRISTKSVKEANSSVSNPVATTNQFVSTAIATENIPMPDGGKIIFASDVGTTNNVSISSFGPRSTPIPVSTMETRYLQKKLRSLGFFDGEFTGVFGENTKRALMQIQLQGNLSTHDGLYTVETRDYIAQLWDMHVETWGFTKKLYKGDRGMEVKRLQQLLTDQKFYSGQISGVYDDLTEKAVLKFQLKQKVVQGGEELGAGTVGPNTMGKLNEVLFRL